MLNLTESVGQAESVNGFNFRTKQDFLCCYSEFFSGENLSGCWPDCLPLPNKQSGWWLTAGGARPHTEQLAGWGMATRSSLQCCQDRQTRRPSSLRRQWWGQQRSSPPALWSRVLWLRQMGALVCLCTCIATAVIMHDNPHKSCTALAQGWCIQCYSWGAQTFYKMKDFVHSPRASLWMKFANE